MCDKLERIKAYYEIELDQRIAQLNNNKSIAMDQIKQMKATMRQEQVNSQKVINKLTQEKN
jgi:hypothetical protein